MPFLERGVPAIGLIQWPYDCWHEPCDDLTQVGGALARPRGRDGARAHSYTQAEVNASPEKLLLAAPRGYCAGVDRAVADRRARARAARRAGLRAQGDRPQQARRRGPRARAARSSSTSSTTTIPEGAVTVFSAHGVSPGRPRRRRGARAADDRRDLPARDQGPPRGGQVRRRRLHDRARRPRRPRGGRGHDGRGPGARSCSSRPRPTSTRSRSTIPSGSPTSRRRRCRSTRPRAIIARLRERFPAITGPRTDDICYATTNRQLAVKQMAEQCDLVLVIGSKNSSNSNRLVDVARDHGAASHLIDNAAEVARGVARRRPRRRHLLRRERARGARRSALVDFFRDARDGGRLRASRSCARTSASCCRRTIRARRAAAARQLRSQRARQLVAVLVELRRRLRDPRALAVEPQRRRRQRVAVRLRAPAPCRATRRSAKASATSLIGPGGHAPPRAAPRPSRAAGRVREARPRAVRAQRVGVRDARAVRREALVGRQLAAGRAPRTAARTAGRCRPRRRSAGRAASNVSYGVMLGWRLPRRCGTTPPSTQRRALVEQRRSARRPSARPRRGGRGRSARARPARPGSRSRRAARRRGRRPPRRSSAAGRPPRR